jgi:DNA-binding MarR family transcriptional regulator
MVSGQNDDMTNLTAGQAQILAALGARHPMTLGQLRSAVADVGMHLDDEEVAAAVSRLAKIGLVEPTPAAELGKFRVTAAGRKRMAAAR